MRAAHGGALVLLAVAVVVLGAAMLVRALTEGGGPLSTGVVFGVLFMAGGGLRLWLLRARSGEDG